MSICAKSKIHGSVRSDKCVKNAKKLKNPIAQGGAAQSHKAKFANDRSILAETFCIFCLVDKWF